MKYAVTIKGTVETEDNTVDVDMDALSDSLAQELDNTDIDVDTIDDDDDEVTVAYKLEVTDVDIDNEPQE